MIHQGLCYENGEFVPKDDVKALSYYERAATQHHAAALYNLGRIYYTFLPFLYLLVLYILTLQENSTKMERLYAKTT